MSISFTDCFTDLRCSEESNEIISAGDSPDVSSSFDSPVSIDDEESIAGLIEDERCSFISAAGVGGGESQCLSPSSVLDCSFRSYSVAWILKVRAFYGFQPVTAYLAVKYLDRFLSSLHLPEKSGWAIQVISVACLSLAAKMEEPLVPSLLDLQVEGAKYVFEPKTIQRMELLVLGVLDWRLRFVTPFSFLSFFAYKLDPIGTCTGFLISRSTDIILSYIREASFVENWASSIIAAAAILCAATEIPILSFATPHHAQSWCHGLSKDKVRNCYKQMQQFVEDHSRKKSIKVIPQFRVTAQITRTRSSCCDDSSSSSSSTSSPSPFNNNKRRRLNNNSWLDDDNHDV